MKKNISVPILLPSLITFDRNIHKVLHIQNMVSRRCKLFVESALVQNQIKYFNIELGEITISKETPEDKIESLSKTLHNSGLEIMSDKNSILIERIIHVVIEMVHYSKEIPKYKFSNYLSEKLNQDYAKLSMLFSKTKGMTIEHFIILHKIEKIKELIMYDELTLSEISDKLHYSSIAHLSQQFKKITGLTPSFYKAMPKKNRINLEDI